MCPHCGDTLASLLGRLGSLIWARCRACGSDYSILADDLADVVLDEINTELENDDDY